MGTFCELWEMMREPIGILWRPPLAYPLVPPPFRLRQQHGDESEATRHRHERERDEAEARHRAEVDAAAAKHRAEADALRKAAEEQRAAAEARLRKTEGDWMSGQEAEISRLKQVGIGITH